MYLHKLVNTSIAVYEGCDLSRWQDNYREGSWHWPLLLRMKGHSYVYGHVSLALTTAYTPLLGLILADHSDTMYSFGMMR